MPDRDSLSPSRTSRATVRRRRNRRTVVASRPSSVTGLVQHFHVAIEPARTCAIGEVEVERQNDARLGEPRLDQVDEAVDPLPVDPTTTVTPMSGLAKDSTQPT